MTFQRGESGNPAGRPPGRGTAAQLRRAIEGRAAEIIDALVASALAGDVTAGKVLLDRVVPSLKAVDSAVAVALGTSLSDSGRAVLAAMSAGRVTPDQAAKLMAGIGTLARVVELDELVARVDALENTHDRSQKPD